MQEIRISLKKSLFGALLFVKRRSCSGAVSYLQEMPGIWDWCGLRLKYGLFILLTPLQELFPSPWRQQE